MMVTHVDVITAPRTPGPTLGADRGQTSAASPLNSSAPPLTLSSTDAQFLDAEITFESDLIGHVEGVIRDSVSQRVRRVITTYGPTRRRVAVPMEWVVNRSAARLQLGVGTRALDDLVDRPRG